MLLIHTINQNTGKVMGIATYTPTILENSELITQETFSYRQSVELQKEVIWRALADTNLQHAIDSWLETLAGLTRKNYR